MAEIAPIEDQPTPLPAKTSSAKRIAWQMGLYLTPFVFAAALVLWGNLLSAWLVILPGCFIFGLIVFAASRHLRDIGGIAGLEAYIHDHLWASIFAIVIVSCLILGTGIYLYVRPPHVKTEANKPVSVSAAPQTTTNSTTPPSPSERGSAPPADPTRTPKKPITVQPHTAAPVPPVTVPSPTISAPNGIAIGGGIVDHPTVNNYAPPTRKISPTTKTELITCLSRHPGTVFIGAIVSETEAYDFATEWMDIFHKAGWSVSPDQIRAIQITQGRFSGVQVTFHGSVNPDNSVVYDSNSPGGAAAICLRRDDVDGGGGLVPRTDIDPDHINFMVGPSH